MSTDHPHLNVPNSWKPDGDIKPPNTFGNFPLDKAIIEKFPIPGTKISSSHAYGMSLWGRCAKVVAELPDGGTKKYFLKVALGHASSYMIKGEFESVKAMNEVLPSIAPQVWTWGKYKTEQNEEEYFLLADFREVGEQPPDPVKFTARLAELHQKSISPTGKFGFHTTTCHGSAPQLTDLWEDTWEALYKKQLGHMFAMDLERNGPSPGFEQLCDITLNKVIPRLLRPLQSDGRNIKPCLVHGDCWDENTATDMETGEPFIFDAGSFYGHNEYDVGNWRAPRHRLSNQVYMKNYKRNFAVSEPEDDWDGRNLLYSLRFNTGAAIIIPGCTQREVVIEDMKELIRTYCKEDWIEFEKSQRRHSGVVKTSEIGNEEVEEEEEEEEVEDEEGEA